MSFLKKPLKKEKTAICGGSGEATSPTYSYSPLK